MAKESSIAPKERVNIVYKPATGDAQEEVELPLRLLVLGDFTQAEDDRPVEDRDPLNIDKDNFNDVLKAHDLKLDLTVPDKLTGEEDDEMNLSLDFQSIKDFEPEAIASKIPQLKNLMELREALTSLKGPLSNSPDFRKKIQSIIKDDDARAKILKELGIDEE